VSSGVLVCGNAVMDLLVRPVESIRWDATTWVESIERSIGGNGANTAYALARLGTPARLMSLVGVDEFGSQVAEILGARGNQAHSPQKPKEISQSHALQVRTP